MLIGVDVCDIERFRASLERTPALREKLFCPAEADLPMPSLAARFAAKEALAKALGAPGNLGWHDAEIISLPSGQPTLEMRGTVLARAAELGVHHAQVTLSHDAGVAMAVVLLV